MIDTEVACTTSERLSTTTEKRAAGTIGVVVLRLHDYRADSSTTGGRQAKPAL